MYHLAIADTTKMCRRKADVRRAIKIVQYCRTTISYDFYRMCDIESCTTFYHTTKVVRYRTCPIFLLRYRRNTMMWLVGHLLFVNKMDESCVDTDYLYCNGNQFFRIISMFVNKQQLYVITVQW